MVITTHNCALHCHFFPRLSSLCASLSFWHLRGWRFFLRKSSWLLKDFGLFLFWARYTPLYLGSTLMMYVYTYISIMIRNVDHKLCLVMLIVCFQPAAQVLLATRTAAKLSTLQIRGRAHRAIGQLHNSWHNKGDQTLGNKAMAWMCRAIRAGRARATMCGVEQWV